MDHVSPTVIVTGASQGIGADVARWLGKIGASVTLVARSADDLAVVAEDVEQLGGSALAFSADIAGQRACRRAVQETLKRFGRLDGLVNNAGIIEPIVPIAKTDPYAWSYNIEVNLFGAFYITQAAIPELRKTAGRVISVSSGAALNPVESWGAYCVAKAGLTHFTRVLAAEEKELTAISVRPGVVDTEMQELIRCEGPKSMPEERAAYFQRLKDENKLEPPHVPARAIAWLALRAPRSLSGEFVNYDDPRIAEPALSLFGDRIG
ncbi:short-chain dehydrogenase [Desulfonema ishimotonii]|uniref:Short-chain dehydrogenase n=1 Tax=Desulfonema ishimotonii TaxID=45657 RepID=A0A401FXV5_9BACT|nr:SDR family NAD(P)-dependent oxidoreductase [Desulfonema ishimotonii]GBC61801.1 short-chain dehydrogenase [Desulfonema ishimotonii]